MLAELSGHRVVVGSKQLRKALESGKATYVFLAQNADPAITEPIEAMCQRCNVAYAWVESKSELGRSCGIEVGAAAAAAVD
ncbi:MAG: ribosomal L7Ae/L30e/S12e/Gadd45 family protein [Oscillospiraceae bacterium]|nr:ribosomal L7Ae/L30e/S12e/Gadd45 family protein [Oscillospiraceae bacterium]